MMPSFNDVTDACMFLCVFLCVCKRVFIFCYYACAQFFMCLYIFLCMFLLCSLFALYMCLGPPSTIAYNNHTASYSSMSEENLSAIIGYAHRRIDQLQKKLAQQEALEKVKEEGLFSIVMIATHHHNE